ncbi:hypothetical protein A6E13_01900 [Aliivibrio fischeri]|nr:hypothetical protein A6E13_01900 [Aliivibrio fischeri]
MIRSVDCLVMLKGWEASEGAVCEYHLAKKLGKAIVFSEMNKNFPYQTFDEVNQITDVIDIILEKQALDVTIKAGIISEEDFAASSEEGLQFKLHEDNLSRRRFADYLVDIYFGINTPYVDVIPPPSKSKLTGYPDAIRKIIVNELVKENGIKFNQ